MKVALHACFYSKYLVMIRRIKINPKINSWRNMNPNIRRDMNTNLRTTYRA